MGLRQLGSCKRYAFCSRPDRRPLKVDFFEEAVHLSGRDALPPLGGNLLHQLKDGMNIGSFRSGDKDYGA